MKSIRPVATIAAALVPLTWALLVFGSTVRAHGAGLACPDWPLCFGEVVPRMDFGIFLEWGHRVLAGGISVVFMGIGAALFAFGAPRRIKVVWGAALVTLCVQIVLGGLTVLHLLAEWTVTSHLLGGNGFALMLLVLALSLREVHTPVQREPVGAAQRAWAARLAVLVLAQLALGGLVSSSHAGLACGTWPGCNGPEWFPTFQGLVGLQVLHRVTAYVLLGVALLAALSTRGRGRTGRAALIVLGLIVLQIVLGVANVLLRIPVEVTLAHAGTAALIVLATTWFNYEAWRAPLAERLDAPLPADAATVGAH